MVKSVNHASNENLSHKTLEVKNPFPTREEVPAVRTENASFMESKSEAITIRQKAEATQ